MSNRRCSKCGFALLEMAISLTFILPLIFVILSRSDKLISIWRFDSLTALYLDDVADSLSSVNGDWGGSVRLIEEIQSGLDSSSGLEAAISLEKVDRFGRRLEFRSIGSDMLSRELDRCLGTYREAVVVLCNRFLPPFPESDRNLCDFSSFIIAGTATREIGSDAVPFVRCRLYVD